MQKHSDIPLRQHTSKQYRSIIPILRGTAPEPIPDELQESSNIIHSAFSVGWYLLLAGIMLIGGCGIAHAEEVNLDIIADIESSSNTLAYNRESGAVGMYQVTEGVLMQYNNQCLTNCILSRYGGELKLRDMYIQVIAEPIANWYINIEIPRYINRMKIPDTITSRLIAYNWGIGHLRKWFKAGSHWNRLPKETRNYIKKYFKEVNNNE